MNLRLKIFQQCTSATNEFIKYSLCDAQNQPTMKELGKDVWQISITNNNGFSFILKDISYNETYDLLISEKLYNFKLLDGAIIQITYKFEKNRLLYHRLGFFPSPYLEEYQNNPEIYLLDEIYADIIKKGIVPFPLRFDYDCSDEKHIVVEHPKSHLTLGQYEHCRIPVSSPITPYSFLNFILRNFYNNTYRKYDKLLIENKQFFIDEIHHEELKIPHLKIPKISC